MRTPSNNIAESRKQSMANDVRFGDTQSATQLKDKRKAFTFQKNLLEGIVFSPRVQQQKTIQRQINYGQPRIVQFYRPVSLDGAMDQESYNIRSRSEALGFNGFGGDNLARAIVIERNEREEQYKAYSTHGVAHSEEKLIKLITEIYGPDILKRPPDAEKHDRIKEIYSERAPCDASNADPSRKSRVETEGSCEKYLSRILHNGIPVLYSVPNDTRQHEALMNRGKSRFIEEVVENRRGISLQNASNRSLAYFGNIRKRCFDKYGKYGRNYFDEARFANEIITRFKATVEAFDLNVDYTHPIRVAFVSVPHYNGSDNESDLVKAAIETAAKKIQAEIDEKAGAFLE